MSILSIGFAAFFAAVLAAYYLIPRKYRWYVLLAASMSFYLMADMRYMVFLLFSLGTSYGAARIIGQSSERSDKIKKRILAMGAVLDIGCLVFLKYYNFGAALFGMPLLGLIMPLGISYYTLTAVGYCVDVYRGQIEPERNFLKYALFVSFFPQIVQGPIPRYGMLAPQLTDGKPFSRREFTRGLQLILWGLFKKMVVADRVAIIVSSVFDGTSYAGSQVVLASVLFAIELYADFSGCTDIVRGGAELLGIELPQNFERPYFAVSIRDFWKRWHISLSTWLRDYVYIPLGGSRFGRPRKYLNLVLTFLLSGLWHGVGFHFVVWGLLHGIYLVMGELLAPVREKFLRLCGVDRSTLGYRIIQATVTFGLVTFAWIFFRANSLSSALAMIASVALNLDYNGIIGEPLMALGLSSAQLCALAAAILIMVLASVLQRKGELRARIARQPLPVRWAMYLSGIAAILIFGSYGPIRVPIEFIYAQF